LSNATYSPSHRQAGAPVINSQSTLRNAHDLCKNVSLEVSNYLVTTVIPVQYLRGQICVGLYTPILHNIDTGRAKEMKKLGQQGMPRTKEILLRAIGSAALSC
jgi:hypothetical protein